MREIRRAFPLLCLAGFLCFTASPCVSAPLVEEGQGAAAAQSVDHSSTAGTAAAPASLASLDQGSASEQGLPFRPSPQVPPKAGQPRWLTAVDCEDCSASLYLQCARFCRSIDNCGVDSCTADSSSCRILSCTCEPC